MKQYTTVEAQERLRQGLPVSVHYAPPGRDGENYRVKRIGNTEVRTVADKRLKPKHVKFYHSSN